MVPGERGARLGRGRERPAAREVIGALRRGCPGSVGGSTCSVTIKCSCICLNVKISPLPLLLTVLITFFLPFCRDGLKLETEVLDGKPRLILAASGIF